MRTAAIKPDDIVEVDRRGWRYMARVVSREKQKLEVEPLDSRVTWRQATARQIRGHWAKRR